MTFEPERWPTMAGRISTQACRRRGATSRPGCATWVCALDRDAADAPTSASRARIGCQRSLRRGRKCRRGERQRGTGASAGFTLAWLADRAAHAARSSHGDLTWTSRSAVVSRPRSNCKVTMMPNELGDVVPTATGSGRTGAPAEPPSAAMVSGRFRLVGADLDGPEVDLRDEPAATNSEPVPSPQSQKRGCDGRQMKGVGNSLLRARARARVTSER